MRTPKLHCIFLVYSLLLSVELCPGQRAQAEGGTTERAQSASSVSKAKTLDFYFVDAEEGNAVLIVSPLGESMLIDGGSSTGRDAKRLLALAKQLGLKQIDYVVVTHYDYDHYEAIPEIAEKIPILNFVDHGANVQFGKSPEWQKYWAIRPNDAMFTAYCKVRDKGRHIVAEPGAKIPIKGMDVLVVTAGGERISKPVHGAATVNPWCASVKLRHVDETDDGQSVGVLITFGKFRFIHLGDLTWNKSYSLFCPRNPLGGVDVYLSTHHGLSRDETTSDDVRAGRACCSEAEVYALQPRVAIMNCGERYHALGTARAWQVMRASPGLEDIWQNHYRIQAGKDNNSPEQFIANMSAKDCQGHWMSLSAELGGSFTVTNSRNGFTKKYPPRK